jgi:hypothetical protein
VSPTRSLLSWPYTPSVGSIIFRVFAAYTAIAAIVAIRYGYVAATESDGPRKSKALLIASLLFSSWFCLEPAISYFYDSTLPIFDFRGRITAVDVRDSSSRHYSAYIRIHTDSGGDIMVHASDGSEFFRPGQLLEIRYRGDTGELIRAHFYSADGKQEGIDQSTINFGRIVLFIIGLFCTWASIRKYRRDPEGAETTADESAPTSILDS